MKLTVVAAAAAVAVAMGVSACSAGSTTAGSTGTGSSQSGSAGTTVSQSGSSSIYIAGVYRNTADAYWVTSMCSAAKEAKALGVKFKTFSISTNDNTQLTQTLDAALLTKPDGLLFAPADSKTFSTKIDQIMQSGIPVTGENPQVPDTAWKYWQSSQDGAKYAPQVLQATKDLSGSAVILNGLPAASAPWETQRYGGIVDGIKKQNSNLKWLPDQLDNFDINKGTQLINAVILAHPDLKLIIASSGPGGQAAAAAVQQAGKTGKIVVLGFDAVPAEVQALKAGTISYLIAQGPGEVAKAQVDGIVDYLRTRSGRGPVSTTHENKQLPLGLLTKDNVDDPANAAYVYSATCKP
jgi:ribose transport system substrate-binding protein